MKLPQYQEKLRSSRPRFSPMVFKAVLLTIASLALIIPLALAALPFIEFFNGMAAQPKAKTQMTYGRVFGEELMVERLPVEGTIPRSYDPYQFADRPVTLKAAVEVGELLENPMIPAEADLLRGQEIYNVYCIACHGTQGNGDGPATGENRFPAPPTLHTDQARKYRDGTIFHIITNGTEKMPGYADKVAAEDRWRVIFYTRALQRSANPLPEDLDE